MKWGFQIIALCSIVVGLGATSLQAGEVFDRVRQSGEVRCGVVDANLPGLSIIESNGKWAGFWIDMCKAVAAASVGDPDGVRFVSVTESTRAAALLDNAIDLMSSNATWTMGREAGTGIRFAEPVLYDGQGFLAPIDAEGKDLKSFGTARVCVRDGTTSLRNLQELARGPYPNIIPLSFQSVKTLMESFFLQKCDIVTSDRTILASLRLAGGMSKEHFVLLPDIVSKEPMALSVRDNDPQWYSIVRWSMLVMIAAEEKGITSSNIDSFADSTDPEIRRILGFEGKLGEALGLDNAWARRIIRAVGNYGEVFARNLGPDTPMGMERGQNELWSRGGLLYSPPIR